MVQDLTTFQSPLSAPGDLLRESAGLQPERLAVGAPGTVLAASVATRPAWQRLSALLDYLFSSARGSVLYRDSDAAGGWQALAPGTTGRVLITGGATANPSWSSNLSVSSTGAVDTGGLATVGSQGDLNLKGKVGVYNNVNTAAIGTPPVVAYGRLTAQTSTIASLATYTVPVASDGSFICSANLLVTAYTSGTLSPNLTWTSEDNVAQSMTFIFRGNGSATFSTITAAACYNSYPMHIRAKANTAITVTVTGTFVATYNMEGLISVASAT